MKLTRVIAWTILVIIFLVGFLPWAEGFDLRALDLMRTNRQAHPDLVIIAVDNQSLQSIGRWPWSRAVHADLLTKLKAYNPRLVGIDVMFAEPENAVSDGKLASALVNLNVPVLLPAEGITRGGVLDEVLLPVPQLREVGNVAIGHVTVPLDSDGVTRRLPRPLTVKDTTYTPFGVLAATQLGAKAPDDVSTSLLHFAGGAGTIATYSYSDVLAGDIPEGALNDKIIFIGATAADLHDSVLAPNRVGQATLPGVEWQATVASNALLGTSLPLIQRWITLVLGLVAGMALLALSPILHARWSLVAGLCLLAAAPLLTFILWRSGIAAGFFWCQLMILGGYVSDALVRWMEAERERRYLRQAIQSYFSPVMVNSIMREPENLKLGGKRMEVTAMFADVRNFTTISESTQPEVLTGLMYEYFTAMTEEIFATDGVLAQFAGDGLFAFWGAPFTQKDHTERAVVSAVGMMRRLIELRKGWEERGLPHVDIGVGINTGTAIVGNFGSAKRFDYTAIGDCVNSASRLEGLNKEHKTNIIISKQVEVKLSDAIKRKHLADVLVKGKTIPITIFEVTPENWLQ